MNYKLLSNQDWSLFKELRLQALYNNPENFASSYSEAKILPDDDFKSMLDNNFIFGAFDDDNLVGIVGYYKNSALKIKHKGVIWGLYLQKEYRAQGISSNLFSELIGHAKDKVSILQLSVNIENKSAINLYKKYGFKIYGQENNAMYVNEKYIDEYLMCLELKNEK